MGNLGIGFAEPILIGDLDRLRDVAEVEGIEEEIRGSLRGLLVSGDEG